jgi:hypothetical protein
MQIHSSGALYLLEVNIVKQTVKRRKVKRSILGQNTPESGMIGLNIII